MDIKNITLLLIFSVFSSCNFDSYIVAKNSAFSGNPITTPTPEFYKIFITHENGGAYSMQLNYLTGAIDQIQTVDINTVLGAPLTNTTNRGLFVNSNGKVMFAHHDTRNIGYMNSDLTAHSTPKILFDAGGTSGFYGLCELPNGNFIVGSHQWDVTKANEYSSSGTFLRTFNTTQTWSFADCVAVSNTRVIWTDYDGVTDHNGDVVISELAAGTWSEVARYITNVQIAGLANSMWFSLVLHTDGNIYVFPFTNGARNKKVLKCSALGNLSDCQLVGNDLTASFASIDVIQGASQLQGRREIAFTSNDRFLYLFDPVDYSVVRKANLSVAVPAPGCCDLRGFKLVGN